MSRFAKGGAAAALLVTVVSGFEGLRRHAYQDTNGIATICYGETKGVQIGDVKTKPECDAMLLTRLDEFANHVENCITIKMPTKVEVAFVSLAYNIGWQGFCRSQVVADWNAGQAHDACDAMRAFNRDRRRVLPGLVERRKQERDLCLQGIAS